MGVQEEQPPEPRPLDRDDVKLAANRCPYCHTDVAASGADQVVCQGCLARQHQSCWDEAKGCSACGGTEALVTRTHQRPNYAPLGVAVLALCLVMLGAMTALTLNTPSAAPSIAPKPANSEVPPSSPPEGVLQFELGAEETVTFKVGWETVDLTANAALPLQLDDRPKTPVEAASRGERNPASNVVPMGEAQSRVEHASFVIYMGSDVLVVHLEPNESTELRTPNDRSCFILRYLGRRGGKAVVTVTPLD